MQKRCIRTINAKSYNYHTEPLFKTCKILKIEDQYKYNVLSFMFLLKNNGLPESFNFQLRCATWQRSFSNADSSVVVGGVGVNFKGGKGQSQKRFSNFFSFLAPPAERQRSFSNADLSVVRLSVCLSVRPSVCPSVRQD